MFVQFTYNKPTISISKGIHPTDEELGNTRSILGLERQALQRLEEHGNVTFDAKQQIAATAIEVADFERAKSRLEGILRRAGVEDYML